MQRANDVTERVLIATSRDGSSFGSSFEPFHASTFVSPTILFFPQFTSPLPFNATVSPRAIFLFWVDSISRKIYYSIGKSFETNPQGIWTHPAPINNVDSTSDTPWATFEEQPTVSPPDFPIFRFVCIWFKVRTTNRIHYSCSPNPAVPGSWPQSSILSGQTTTTGPSFIGTRLSGPAAGDFGALGVYKSEDTSDRIFTLAVRLGGFTGAAGPENVEAPFCCTSFTPTIFDLTGPGASQPFQFQQPTIFFVDKSSRRILFFNSVYTSASSINNQDSTKDQVWALRRPDDSICVYFTSNDILNRLRVSCSKSGEPGSWPVSQLIN